jgi:hypothetical protein
MTTQLEGPRVGRAPAEEARTADVRLVSTRHLEIRLRQASLVRRGSALRLREREPGRWEAAFTLLPSYRFPIGRDLPTWLAEEATSKREALLALWQRIDECPQFGELRRVRDR